MFIKKFKATTLAVTLACLGLGSTAVLANGYYDHDYVIDSAMSRIDPDATSGDTVSTVRKDCGDGVEGWDRAKATLRIEQEDGASTARVRIRGAKPNTVFTVWLRMKGNGPDGSVIGGSPLTGGGATPLAPGSALDGMIHYTPPFDGTPTPTNGFTTNRRGGANFTIGLDFPVVGGAYPFQRASTQAVADWQAAGGNPDAETKPSPVVNPDDPDISAPFLIRVISHCQDGLGHGLSPAKREAWFQYP